LNANAKGGRERERKEKKGGKREEAISWNYHRGFPFLFTGEGGGKKKKKKKGGEESSSGQRETGVAFRALLNWQVQWWGKIIQEKVKEKEKKGRKEGGPGDQRHTLKKNFLVSFRHRSEG